MVAAMKVFAPAKINLTLDITGIRPDGYHLMEMVMQSVSLYDTLKVEKNAEKGIYFTSDAAYLPTDERNLAVKAAGVFLKHAGIDPGLSIHLTKRIPSGAGMGGGSADAAAVLVALDRICGTGLPMNELMALGETIGADVPFCLHGGTALVKGIGEQVESVCPMPGCFLAVVKPRISVHTKAAFEAFDRGVIHFRPDNEEMLRAICAKDLSAIASNLCNVFEETAHLEELDAIKSGLMAEGALGALMTGSGSAVYGIFAEKEPAMKACGTFRRKKNRYQAFLCEPILSGPVIQMKS